MSKKSETSTSRQTRMERIKRVKDITEYKLSTNDLRVLHVYRKGTGVVTSDIVYRAGSRDENRGETGLAHMLEHMLFKPTKQDLKRNLDSSAMHFERETGSTLNANTWKDRTSYYFSYPKEHFSRALQIEAERMQDVILTDKEFLPERTNVLSEFDMYAGDEQFSLSVEMMSVAFRSHTYGHETIGYREDIEAYTIEKLDRFYRKFYQPNNAVLIIVGDVTETEMKKEVITQFARLRNTHTEVMRTELTEPKQEGLRSVTIERKSETQVYARGVRHEPFPSKSWFETMMIFEMLAGGSDSILHKKLIDSGLATTLNVSLEPSRSANLAILFVTLTKKTTHEKMDTLITKVIGSLTEKDISPYLRKILAKALTDEAMTRENSLSFASELVEYVSAGVWEEFFNSEEMLCSITTADISKKMSDLFLEKNTTTGYFIGNKIV